MFKLAFGWLLMEQRKVKSVHIAHGLPRIPAQRIPLPRTICLPDVLKRQFSLKIHLVKLLQLSALSGNACTAQSSYHLPGFCKSMFYFQINKASAQFYDLCFLTIDRDAIFLTKLIHLC